MFDKQAESILEHYLNGVDLQAFCKYGEKIGSKEIDVRSLQVTRKRNLLLKFAKANTGFAK